MPRNVASPEQSAVAQAQTAAIPASNRFSRVRPFTRFEREALNAPVESVFLYNISTIFKWSKDYPGLGALTVFPRKQEQEYSDAISFEKHLVRTYDGGNRIQRLMVETPLEIVEDFLVCSPDYPGRPQNNLVGYGCFYTIGQPLEKFTAHERQDILDGAELKARTKYHEKVAEADAFNNSPNLQWAVVEVHKQSALYLHEVGEISELPDWVARRAKLNTTDECQFCGFANKRGVAKCRNCSEILDQELYAKLTAARDKKKTS